MRIRTTLLSLLLACAPLASAAAHTVSQDASETATAQDAESSELDSPRATMFTFLGAIREVQEGDTERWKTVLECIEFGDTPIVVGTEASRTVARDLWGALNHIRVVSEEELPDAEAIGARSSFVYFPRPFDDQDEAIRRRARLGDERIELVRGEGGRWRFSPGTVLAAHDLYLALLPLGRKADVDETVLETQSLVRRWMPDALRDLSFLDLEAWQWIGLALLVFLGVLLDQVLRGLARGVGATVLGRYRVEVRSEVLTRFARPLGLLGAGLTWLTLLRPLDLPLTAEEILLAAARTFVILAGTWAAWRSIDFGAEFLLHRAKQTESRFDDVLVPLVSKSLKIVATAFGLIYAAQSLRINIVPLITGLGIGGLAFAFAAKDTIENFFGSVAVILDRPFEVGDWVVIGDVEGTVEELGFRSTRVRTFYNSQITIPNSTLVRATVDNFGRRKYRRWKTVIGLQYDTPPEQLLAFTTGIQELVRNHPYTRKDYYQVWCNEFGPSSIDVLVYVFHQVPDWSTELRERERLLVDIVRLADRLGVSFAFPTRTVHLYKEEHAPPAVRFDPPGRTSDRRSMVQGIRAAQAIVADQGWKEQQPAGVEFSKAPTDLSTLSEHDPLESTEDTRSS
jgi:MscS family membrane protein